MAQVASEKVRSIGHLTVVRQVNFTLHVTHGSGAWSASFNVFVLGLTLFNTCSRRRLQVYDSSSWNAALVAIHDKLDLPTIFMLCWRSPWPLTVLSASRLHARFVHLRSLVRGGTQPRLVCGLGGPTCPLPPGGGFRHYRPVFSGLCVTMQLTPFLIYVFDVFCFQLPLPRCSVCGDEEGCLSRLPDWYSLDPAPALTIRRMKSVSHWTSDCRP